MTVNTEPTSAMMNNPHRIADRQRPLMRQDGRKWLPDMHLKPDSTQLKPE